MAVDQTRHQGAAAAVDHFGLGQLDRLVGDLFDLVAVNDKFVAAQQLADLGVEHLKVLEMVECHGARPLKIAVAGSLRRIGGSSIWVASGESWGEYRHSHTRAAISAIAQLESASC